MGCRKGRTMKAPRTSVGLVLAVLLAAPAYCAFAQAESAGVAEGVRALESNDFARAEQIFAELVKADPTATNVAYLAIAESSAGHFDQSLAHFQQAIRLGNDSASLHYYFGLAYLKHGDNDLGIPQFKLALEKNPHFDPARVALGAALLNAGRPSQAIPYLEQARVGSAHDAEFWANLVRAYFEAGNRNKALQATDSALDAVPDDPRLASTLAFLCLHHQEPQKARTLLENASELRPQDGDLKILLAETSIKAGEPEEALAVLKDVPAGAGAAGELSFLRGTAYLLVGNLEDSRSNLAEAIRIQPTNPDYLFAYAGLQGSELLYSEALGTLEKALQLAPHSEPLLYQTAVTYALMGRYQDAILTCKQTLEYSRANDEVYFLMGVINLEERNFGESRGELEKALALNSKVAAYHGALGVALYEDGDLKRSLDQLSESLSLDPQLAPAYLWRSRLYAREGENAKAKSDSDTYRALNASSHGDASPTSANQAHASATKNAAAENSEENPSFLDQLWLTRVRERLGEVAGGG
jgi:protein O-GlcNAc transferase